MNPETRFWNKLREHVKDIGGLPIKIAGGLYQQSGLPDALVILAGNVNFIELKAIEKLPANPWAIVFDLRRRLTPLQRTTLETIHRAGGRAWLGLHVHKPASTMFLPFPVFDELYRAGTILTVGWWGTTGLARQIAINEEAALKTVLAGPYP